MQRVPLPFSLTDEPLLRALSEDLGSGDITTEACVSPEAVATAHGVARTAMVVCGVTVALRVFQLVDADLTVEAMVADGTHVDPATVVWRVRGRARSILMAERVALNFAQRMSAIATVTRRYVDAIPSGCSTCITDTRKTTPGLRLFERYAVRCGGGHNHRNDLGSAVLIKDNHLAVAGSVTAAIAAARSRAPHTSRVECEVDSLEQLDEALAAGADIILLDNMQTATVVEAVRRVQKRALLEASGGITLERVADLARAGVDAISVGALTHSAPAADLSLDFVADRSA